MLHQIESCVWLFRDFIGLAALWMCSYCWEAKTEETQGPLYVIVQTEEDIFCFGPLDDYHFSHFLYILNHDYSSTPFQMQNIVYFKAYRWCNNLSPLFPAVRAGKWVKSASGGLVNIILDFWHEIWEDLRYFSLDSLVSGHADFIEKTTQKLINDSV